MTQRRDPERFLRRLRALDDILAEHGFPRISPWWWTTLERFYRTGKRRLVVRKGRRVGASTIVAPRLAVAEMLYGEHRHTPGAPPLAYVFLSVRRDEAANRLRGIRVILDILGERYAVRDETIELAEHPAVFSVVTASFRTAVGDTVAFAWADEVARWNDDGKDPAHAVISSLSPALATLPDARLFLVSTPLGLEDFHAREFERGETFAQSVAWGATWEINPTLTREACQALAPDPEDFDAEYGSIPRQGETNAFPRDDAARTFEPRVESFLWHRPVLVIDVGEVSDSFAWGLAAWGDPDPRRHYKRLQPPPDSGLCADTFVGYAVDAFGNQIELPRAQRPLLNFFDVGGWRGTEVRELGMDAIVASLCALARRYDTFILGDQRGAPYLTAMTSKHEVPFRSVTYSQESKHEAVTLLRSLMRDRMLRIVEHEEMRRQVLRYRRRIIGSGFKYGVPSERDDYACLLVTLAHLLNEENHGHLSAEGSPTVQALGGRFLAPGR